MDTKAATAKLESSGPPGPPAAAADKPGKPEPPAALSQSVTAVGISPIAAVGITSIAADGFSSVTVVSFSSVAAVGTTRPTCVRISCGALSSTYQGPMNDATTIAGHRARRSRFYAEHDHSCSPARRTAGQPQACETIPMAATDGATVAGSRDLPALKGHPAHLALRMQVIAAERPDSTGHGGRATKGGDKKGGWRGH